MSGPAQLELLPDGEVKRHLYLAQIQLRFAQKGSTIEQAMADIDAARAELKRRNIPEPV